MGEEIDHQDADYKGELTGKHLRDGPLNDRKCTDLLCFLLFALFWIGMIAVGVTAITRGESLAFTRVYDRNGDACGVDDAQHFPYLMFKNKGSNLKPLYDFNSTYCVDQCPVDSSTIVSCYNKGAAQTTCPQFQNEIDYPTLGLFQRFCVPTDATLKSELLNNDIDFSFFSRAGSDLIQTWQIILAVGVLALVFGFIYIFLMKYLSGVLLWTLLASFVIGSGVFGYICLTTEPNHLTTLGRLTSGQLKAIAYSCFGIAALSLVAIIFLRERITLSIAVLKAAAHFLEDEPKILILPPVFLVFTLLFYVGWILVVAFIIGTNDFPKPTDGFPFAKISWTPAGIGMFAYYLFALCWNHAFGVALSQFIIASTVCLWYFKHGSRKGGVSPIGRSFKRSVYHMGSLALGSFVIGLAQFIKFILNYIQKRVTRLPDGENSKARFIVACCSCAVACFERGIKFLTTHAYVQIAMTGESFCKATTEAYFLSLRNAMRFGMVHGFAYLFLFLGQLIISGGATAVGYLIITRTDSYKDVVVSPVVPSVFFFLTSYIISHVFMGIYGMSADTIIHCFAMDEEIHDGTVQHAPEELRGYVDDHLSKRLLVGDYE